MDPATSIYDIGDVVVLSCTFLTGQTKGSISAGQSTLTVQDASGLTAAQSVFVAGAGTIGGDLVSVISSIVGNVLTLATAAGTNVSKAACGQLTTPTLTTCTVLQPDGTETTPAVTTVSAGRATANFSPTQAGDHFARWLGTGTAAGATERQFVVRPERVI